MDLAHTDPIVAGDLRLECALLDGHCLRNIEREHHVLLGTLRLPMIPDAPARNGRDERGIIFESSSGLRVGGERSSRAIRSTNVQLNVHRMDPGRGPVQRGITLDSHENRRGEPHGIGERAVDETSLSGFNVHLMLIENRSPKHDRVLKPRVPTSSVREHRTPISLLMQRGKSVCRPARKQGRKSMPVRLAIDTDPLPSERTEDKGGQRRPDIVSNDHTQAPTTISVLHNGQTSEEPEEIDLPSDVTDLEPQTVRPRFCPSEEGISPKEMISQTIVQLKRGRTYRSRLVGVFAVIDIAGPYVPVEEGPERLGKRLGRRQEPGGGLIGLRSNRTP